MEPQKTLQTNFGKKKKRLKLEESHYFGQRLIGESESCSVMSDFL